MENGRENQTSAAGGLDRQHEYDVLAEAARRARRYLETTDERPTYPSQEAAAGLSAFDEPLPQTPQAPLDVLSLLDRAGSPATVTTTGRRYFGFVIGGSLPAALAANWLAGAWDQNAAMQVMSPIGAKLEEVSIRWLLELLGIPREAGCGFVTGATMANFSGLAAARHALLQRQDWDVEARGLFGAPEITVVVGEEVHVSLLKALSLLGLGRERVVRVPVDDQGRMLADRLPELSRSTIVCLQAGNVNTGAFDPAEQIIPTAHQAGAWVHVDGAFGLWAAASPDRAGLMAGYNQADSWATDAHKWLNVPYDCGLVFCKSAPDLRAALSHIPAAYLQESGQREAMEYTPEMSRRARGIEIWAALRSLGKSGLADMIERCCRLAERFAGGMKAAGFEVLNDVVLNQVLVSFGSAERTNRVITAVQKEGTAWFGGTVWQGKTAMRISVSGWTTTEEDVDLCVEAIVRCAKG